MYMKSKSLSLTNWERELTGAAPIYTYVYIYIYIYVCVYREKESKRLSLTNWER